MTVNNTMMLIRQRRQTELGEQQGEVSASSAPKSEAEASEDVSEIVQAIKKAISGGDKLDITQITKMLERVTVNEKIDAARDG